MTWMRKPAKTHYIKRQIVPGAILTLCGRMHQAMNTDNVKEVTCVQCIKTLTEIEAMDSIRKKYGL